MHTKKAIFAWWEGLGDKEIKDDLTEFQESLKPPCFIERDERGYNKIKLTLNSPRWKHPLILWFAETTRECFRIVGY